MFKFKQIYAILLGQMAHCWWNGWWTFTRVQFPQSSLARPAADVMAPIERTPENLARNGFAKAV
jgi:hypothetical protein